MKRSSQTPPPCLRISTLLMLCDVLGSGVLVAMDRPVLMRKALSSIENGFVHLPKEAGWRAEYLHELTVFPGGKYDDQVDSTAQLLDWLKGAGREPGGIYQYYKELAQQPQTARPEPLSVMAKRLGLLRW